MAYKSLRMDKIKQIIDYHAQGIAKKKIARLLGISKNTVKKYIDQAIDIVEDPSSLSVEDLQEKLETTRSAQDVQRAQELEGRIEDILKELGRVGVTRHLLWLEYSKEVKGGYSYSHFCDILSSYQARQNVTIRLDHEAARTLSIDFSGKRIPWIDKRTAEVHYAEVLVCTMPYSAYTFACALPSQKQEDFIDGINQALLYIGGLPRFIQSDNLKSFVTKPDRYAPTFNQLCVQMSGYYGVELEATRVGRPKDKASVERHVSIVYTKVYAPLRDQTFHSIGQINEAFSEHIEKMNTTLMQGKTYSRKDRFDADEKEHLKPLPSAMFEITKSTKAKVQRNYHVILGEDRHQYSVPYQYVGKQTIINYSSKTVEVYVGQQRIATHTRDYRQHGYTSLHTHMPKKHQMFIETRGWDADYFKREAFALGPYTLWVMDRLLQNKPLLEQTCNACRGLLSLSKTYTPERLENACMKAHKGHRTTLEIIRNILQNNMDNAPEQSKDPNFKVVVHPNLRGASQYP